MVNPIFEKIVIVVSILLALAGLWVLVDTFPTAGIGFVVASIVGIACVFGLVAYFSRSPA